VAYQRAKATALAASQLRVDLPRDAAFTAQMRPVLMLLCALLIATSGCLSHRSKSKQPSGAPIINGPAPNSKVILTPESGLSGRVKTVNPGGRFVVLNFPVGHLPGLEQRLNVYRLGLKTGEVKITGPQYDDNIVGDIIAGEVQPGDEVRDR
jgi:hypothetical protein